VTASWALPRIVGDVPHELTPRTLASANARIARLLIDAEAVRNADIPAQWRDPLEVCHRALNAWLKRELGDLHCIAPRFVLRPAMPETASFPPNADAAPSDFGQVDVIWFQQQEQQWAVGEGVERLERLVPRLGATALDVLEAQSRFVYPVFTPRIAHEVASMMYWYGEEDETTALQECCGDDLEAQEAMRADMITKARIVAAYPEWALAWKPATLRLRELQQIVGNSTESYACDVAALVLQLARMRMRDAFRPEADGEFIGFGAVLAWHEDDVAVRIYDDLVNMAHESEFCDLMGEVHVDLDDPRALQAWQRGMRQRFKAMRLIDTLLWRLFEAH
jgi:PRTRC genetic system protein F